MGRGCRVGQGTASTLEVTSEEEWHLFLHLGLQKRAQFELRQRRSRNVLQGGCSRVTILYGSRLPFCRAPGCTVNGLGGKGTVSTVQPGGSLRDQNIWACGLWLSSVVLLAEVLSFSNRHTGWSVSRSVMPDSWRLHGLEPTRLLCPWNFPGKNNRVGCHSLLQGIFLTQGLNPYSCIVADSFFTVWARREANISYPKMHLALLISAFPKMKSNFVNEDKGIWLLKVTNNKYLSNWQKGMHFAEIK